MCRMPYSSHNFYFDILKQTSVSVEQKFYVLIEFKDTYSPTSCAKAQKMALEPQIMDYSEFSAETYFLLKRGLFRICF